MKYNSKIHHRKSLRLKDYDYSQNGLYFITICTVNREQIFGNILNKKMELNDLGNIVKEEWEKSFLIRQELFCETFVIMPNHLHAIIKIANIDNCVGTNGRSSEINEEMIYLDKSQKSIIQKTNVETNGRSSEINEEMIYLDKSQNSIIEKTNVWTNDRSSIQSNKNIPIAKRMPKSISSFVAGFKSIVTTRINKFRNLPKAKVWQYSFHDHIIRNRKSYHFIVEYIKNNPANWESDKFNLEQ